LKYSLLIKMNKEQFDSLPIEHKRHVVKTYVDLVYDAVSHRMQMLPAISALAATLLVVATFNDKLISLNNLVRFLISILLLIIPISLFAYNYDLKKSQIKNQQYLERLFNEDLTPQNITIPDKVTTLLPDILVWILAVVIFFLVFIIWKNIIFS